MLDVNPVTLEGTHVRLLPLRRTHAEGLRAAGSYDQIWTYTATRMNDPIAYIETALRNERLGTELPFAIVERGSGQVIGSTRFLGISPADRGLEIGSTWLTPSVWKTSVNTECKYLLLRHCFEELGCIRVQLKTDRRNENSQRAIERIGAVREGVLRNHAIVQNGYVRDTVMFSIIDREWPAVKNRLELLLFGES
ncbi:GNAT family N-acetyltransferase [Brevibacillus sp. TJ4]|uniref:GNAT family N-acetyltransferase n=1 Tax=Brevibacillus sp. TJ4 TaxID=3234853 RepID=UPI003BA20B69